MESKIIEERRKVKFEGLPREMTALRASKEIKDGDYVNLGIGIPTLISNWIEGRDVTLQSEIGMLKTGPLAFGNDIDQDLINASCQPVTQLPGTAYFDITESFAMIRGRYMDIIVMGALQVNARGDYAGWANPARGLDVGNIGGSMDLCAGANKLLITMEHTIEVTLEGLVLKEVYPGLTSEDIQLVTEPKLIIAPDLKELEL